MTFVKQNFLNNSKLKKNETTHLTRSGKKAYYQKYFAENNLQKIWNGIKEIINIKFRLSYMPPSWRYQHNRSNCDHKFF